MVKKLNIISYVVLILVFLSLAMFKANIGGHSKLFFFVLLLFSSCWLLLRLASTIMTKTAYIGGVPIKKEEYQNFFFVYIIFLIALSFFVMVYALSKIPYFI